MKKELQYAQKVYKESIRGRDYQDELLIDNFLTDNERDKIKARRDLFQDRICLIEDIFGAKALKEGL